MSGGDRLGTNFATAGRQKNPFFALKIAFVGPKFLKFSEWGQSAFFGSQEGGAIFGPREGLEADGAPLI